LGFVERLSEIDIDRYRCKSVFALSIDIQVLKVGKNYSYRCW